MYIQQLSRKMEQDVSYLRWRAETHRQSTHELMSRFADLADNYRRLVESNQKEQLEQLINSYRISL